MSLPIVIEGSSNGHRVKVTSTGALFVEPAAYDLTSFNTLDVVSQGYTFYPPKSGQQFVMTGILAFADKDVNDSTDTVITIYEADTEDSATVEKVLLQFGLGKLTSIPVVPLNLLINKGKYVNAKTGDDDIHLTIMGHYINHVV